MYNNLAFCMRLLKVIKVLEGNQNSEVLNNKKPGSSENTLRMPKFIFILYFPFQISYRATHRKRIIETEINQKYNQCQTDVTVVQQYC